MSALKKLVYTTLTFCIIVSTNSIKANINTNYQTVKVNPRATVSLFTNADVVKPGQTFYAVFHLQLKPGWHSYWINPGESGLAPAVNWQLPSNFTAAPIEYLPPKRLILDNFVTFVYERQADYIIPITATANAATGKYNIYANFDYLICSKDACEPESADLGFAITVGSGSQFNHKTETVERLLAQQAKSLTSSMHYQVDGKTLKLIIKPAPTLIAESKKNIKEVIFFPQQSGLIKLEQLPTTTWSDDTLTLRLARDFKLPENTIDGIVAFVMRDGQHYYYQLHARPKDKDDNTGMALTNTPHASLLWYLLLAFIGGIILNIMPCVFPILSLKAISIFEARHQHYRSNLMHGIAYTVGILVSFLIFAIIVLILKQFGHLVGWGFQMQSPTVVAILTYILFIIGLNLSGVFQFSNRFANIGQGLVTPGNYRGSFFTGVLAVVVATPCTAPFMGTAIGFAFTQPPLILTTILLALGLGMALPLLLLSIVPILRYCLPKPGHWMVTFKEFLAFPMYLSCAWLLWVLMQQTQSVNVLLILAGLVLIAFGCWLLNKSKRMTSVLGILTLIVFIIAIYPLYHLPNNTTTPSSPHKITSKTNTFNTESLQNLLAEHKPVMVNITADWCLTCKLNENTVLNTETFQQALNNTQVVFLQGDWTNRNASIFHYLQQFDRSGIPFTIIYNRQGEYRILPNILTMQNTLDMLEWADEN
ncbi:MAG: thioredoxin family protein [Pseudomonadota bacterium]